MKKSCPKLLLSLILCACATLMCQAQTEIEEEEGESFEQFIQEFPFAQTAYTQELREVQQTVQLEHSDAEGQVENSLGYVAEYGVTDWFQLSLGYTQDYQQFRKLGAGTGWLEAGTMVSMLNRSNQSAVFFLEAAFPVKNPDPEFAEAEAVPVYTPMLLYARRWGETQLHLNAGTELKGEDQRWFYNAAVVYGTGNWHPLLELNAEAEEEFNFFVAPGFVLNNDQGWEVVAGVRRSLIKADWGFSIRLLHEFTIDEK